jgi:hypothetical protein
MIKDDRGGRGSRLTRLEALGFFPPTNIPFTTNIYLVD